MAFWGLEIKPGKPFTHRFDSHRGRLHISQATLGDGSSTKKSLVQLNVGDKSPVLLCSLLPDKIETCPLDLEFEEEDEIIFSVLGPRSVHLSGYYISIDSCGHGHDDDDTDSYGEDIAESDTEQSEDYGTEDEDEYDEDFIDDDLEMFPPPPRRKSAVVIEEIEDDEKPTNGNGSRKRLKKKYQMSDSESDDEKQIVVKDDTRSKVLESEDEDGFPISSITKKKATSKSNEEGKSEKKKAKDSKKVENGSDLGAGSKRKLDTIVQDSEAEKNKVPEQPEDVSLPSTETGLESDVKPKKKKKEGSKKKERGAGDGSQGDVQEANQADPEVAKADKMDQDPVNDKPKENKSINDAGDVAAEDQSEKKKKKKKKKKSKAQESDENASKDGGEKKELTVETEHKKKEVKKSKVRTFGNGLVIEDLQMGKPDGQKADVGKKVKVKYIGKLKSNGKIFDSNINGPPFEFRLGVEQVIRGWDIGVNGMRVGDKRRLTIPPEMGYGARGAPPKIPQNAWLVFDVELISVR